MGLAYLVLAAIAAFGAALGWRLTPSGDEDEQVEGLARLLQLGIALTGLGVIALLLVPWFLGLDQIACTDELERAGNCIIGLSDRGLFGAAGFAGLVGAAFALVLRKGILDFPAAELRAREAGAGDLDTILAPRGHDEDEGGARAARDHGDAEPDEESDDDAPTASRADDDDPDDDDDPADADASDDQADADASGQAPHRRQQGPVFRAFVDDEVVDLDVAIRAAAERLRSERVAVVFSRGASKDANVALLELAEAFDAHRYVLEGTAAATEGIPTDDEPDPHAADEVAGPSAHHAGQLALDLAGSLIQTVFLLDTRVAFPEFVLGKLTELQSVCIAHAHDEVSGACQIVLPGTNPGEREGELVDSDGGTNARRARVWLVGQIVSALRELEGDGAKSDSDDKPDAESDADGDKPDADKPDADKPDAESNADDDDRDEP